MWFVKLACGTITIAPYVLQAPGMRERMANIDATPAGNSSEVFTQYVREDIARWAKVVKAAGITPQ